MAIKRSTKTGWILLLLVMLMLIFWFASREDKKHDVRTHNVTLSQDSSADNTAGKTEQRKIKYWAAPMDPTYIRDKPGKSPMGMDLVPVYEDKGEETDKSVITIDPVVVQNIGVRTAKVSSGTLHTAIRAVGHVTYDEKRIGHIRTKISGWVEKLFIDSVGEKVHKGKKLLSIYSPELVATQEEYLQALKYKEKTAGSKFEDVVKSADTLLESTRKRLLLMDIDPKQIKALEKSRQVQKDMILHSPTAGIVIEKHVLNGMKVDPMMELYTIADLSRVWVIASVYEYELPFIKIGQEAEVTLSYEPGAKYKGRVDFVYPFLSSKTRTVQVRMEFDNPELKLKPDMFADVVIKTKTDEDAILVPSEAIIRTGSRNVVITSLGDGKFLPKMVTVGPEGEGFTQIISGLNEEEIIVTSGQFLIDSESNLRETINKMLKIKEPESEAKEETGYPDEHGTVEMKMEEKMHEHKH